MSTAYAASRLLEFDDTPCDFAVLVMFARSQKVDVTRTQQSARCAALELLAAFELDRRLKGTKVDVTARHPGIAATEGRAAS